MVIKTRTIIISVLIALVVCFTGGWLLGRFARNNVATSIINGQNDIIHTYSYEINGLQKQAYEKDATIASQRQAIKEGLILKEELKALKIKYIRDLTKINGTIDILLDSIAHFHPIVIPCPDNENYHPVLYLPLAWRDTTEFYDIRGQFDTTGYLSMHVGIPLDLDVWTGRDTEVKGNLKVVVTSLNPYVKINSIKSLVFDIPKPRKWGIGIIGGYGLSYVDKQIKPAPFIGVGVTRTIVSF